jgi:hypothetical protein
MFCLKLWQGDDTVVLLKPPAVDITICYTHAGVHFETYLSCRSYEIVKCVRREVLDSEDELRFVESSEILAQRHSFSKVIFVLDKRVDT